MYYYYTAEGKFIESLRPLDDDVIPVSHDVYNTAQELDGLDMEAVYKVIQIVFDLQPCGHPMSDVVGIVTRYCQKCAEDVCR